MPSASSSRQEHECGVDYLAEGLVRLGHDRVSGLVGAVLAPPFSDDANARMIRMHKGRGKHRPYKI